jgi:hypothetical protein
MKKNELLIKGIVGKELSTTNTKPIGLNNGVKNVQETMKEEIYKLREEEKTNQRRRRKRKWIDSHVTEGRTWRGRSCIRDFTVPVFFYPLQS